MRLSYVVLDAEGKALRLLREPGSRARPGRAASASKTTYENFNDFSPLFGGVDPKKNEPKNYFNFKNL